MVSATDVITYVGVPLAVLGVSPILYTFVSALYTKNHLRRVLYRNHVDAQVRARMMTGVVEVDLPVYQLEPLGRDEAQYWTKPVLPMSIEGASWSHFNWFKRETDRVCVRFQRADKIVFPESQIDFEKLVVFLLDRGASPSSKGFNALRHRGQQIPVGTVLIDIKGDSGLEIPVLTVAKPGERHGSISLRLHWSQELHRRDVSSLPLTWICIPSVHAQQAPVLTSIDNSGVADISQIDNLRSGTTNPRLLQPHRHFIRIGTKGVEDLFIEAEANRSSRRNLQPDHLELLSVAGQHWEAWFACAAIAVFGFKHGTVFRYKPSTKVLYFAREGAFPVSAAFHLNLIDRLSKTGEWSLQSLYSHEGLQPVDDWSQKIVSQLQEHAEKLQKERISHKELWKLSKWSGTRTHGPMRQLITRKEPPNLRSMMAKYVSMSELLKLCLLFLRANPVKINSHPILDTVSKHWEVDQFSQEAAEAVIRAMAVDHDFAASIYVELDNAMAIFMGKRETIWEQFDSFATQDASGIFCSAIILLAVIGKRAAYLLSGEDIEICEREWKMVYVS
ncbi:hypothetical protein MMC07_006737 [Pseudocyphellaria aurata]|nr:hypothetical protein [Pseudocyphellaria aurata]